MGINVSDLGSHSMNIIMLFRRKKMSMYIHNQLGKIKKGTIINSQITINRSLFLFSLSSETKVLYRTKIK